LLGFNLLGCILLWAGSAKNTNSGSGFFYVAPLDLSMQALISSFFVIAAICSSTQRWNQISLFVNVWVQFSLLGCAISFSTAATANQSSLLTAGGVIAWIAHLGFIALNYFMTPNIKFVFSFPKSIRLFVLIGCLVAAVVGGAIATSPGGDSLSTLVYAPVQWSLASMCIMVLILIFAGIQEPKSPSQNFGYIAAIALVLAISGSMVANARILFELPAATVSGRFVAGVGLSLFFGWLSVLVSVELQPQEFLPKLYDIKANKWKLIACITVLINFTGCFLWWIDLNKAANVLQVAQHSLAVTAFLSSVFFSAVYLFGLQYPSRILFLFFGTNLTLSLMYSVAGTTNVLAPMGNSLCWIANILFLGLVSVQCLNDLNMADGFDHLLDPEKGPEDLSYSPPPTYQYDPTNAEDSAIGDQAAAAPTDT
jgi:hypothetical protein